MISIVHWLIVLVFHAAIAIPLWIIMRRIGHAWWAAAAAFLPMVNFALILALAVVNWPIPDAREYDKGFY